MQRHRAERRRDGGHGRAQAALQEHQGKGRKTEAEERKTPPTQDGFEGDSAGAGEERAMVVTPRREKDLRTSGAGSGRLDERPDRAALSSTRKRRRERSRRDSQSSAGSCGREGSVFSYCGRVRRADSPHQILEARLLMEAPELRVGRHGKQAVRAFLGGSLQQIERPFVLAQGGVDPRQLRASSPWPAAACAAAKAATARGCPPREGTTGFVEGLHRQIVCSPGVMRPSEDAVRHEEAGIDLEGVWRAPPAPARPRPARRCTHASAA